VTWQQRQQKQREEHNHLLPLINHVSPYRTVGRRRPTAGFFFAQG
jgi:hypothetical protein